MHSQSEITNAGLGTNGESPMDDRIVPPLGMTGEQFKEAIASSAKEIEKYYSDLPSRSVLPSIAPGYLQKLLPNAAPEAGESWGDIEKDIERTIMPGITHWQHPKFMAFFASTTTFPSILGELWSSSLSSPAFNWICSPAVTELETIVMDWLAQAINLPETFLSKGEGGGVIQQSASDAIVTMMVCARERYIRRQLALENVTGEEDVEDRSCEIRSKLVALGSDQSHSSTRKGAVVAGTRYRSITTYHCDGFAMKASELKRKIDELHAMGLHPYYLTVTLGTTGTCAVDDFDAIAEVSRLHPDIWIHCDAAWAGSALVLPEYQHLAQTMSFVDSFNFNLAKWLLVNFDASCLWVQKRRDLTDTLSITPSYLRNQYTESGLVTDYRDWQIPLGRRFRALKIWFVLRTWGIDGLRRHVQHGINLGRLIADLIRSRSDLFSIFTPPEFALTVFTVTPQSKQHPVHNGTGGSDPRPAQDRHIAVKPEVDDAELEKANQLTKEVYEAIDEGKEYFLTSTVVGGVYAIRVVSANPLAEDKYIRQLFDVLVRTTEEALRRTR